jgi:hypothetical protein
MIDQIFDTHYISEQSTEGSESNSEIKKFLKNPISEEQIKRYGTSKPKRVVIRANTSGC